MAMKQEERERLYRVAAFAMADDEHDQPDEAAPRHHWLRRATAAVDAVLAEIEKGVLDEGR